MNAVTQIANVALIIIALAAVVFVVAYMRFRSGHRGRAAASGAPAGRLR
jgi:hypothetical protein